MGSIIAMCFKPEDMAKSSLTNFAKKKQAKGMANMQAKNNKKKDKKKEKKDKKDKDKASKKKKKK